MNTYERFMGPRESPTLPPAERVCRWCRKGGEHREWEYVNGRRWYHAACIDLMDMIS